MGYLKLPKSLSVPHICPVFWLVLYLTGQGSTWPESFLSFVQGRTPNISSVLVKAAFFLLIWACSSHWTPPGAPCVPLRSYVVGCFPSERASSPPPLSVEEFRLVSPWAKAVIPNEIHLSKVLTLKHNRNFIELQTTVEFYYFHWLTDVILPSPSMISFVVATSRPKIPRGALTHFTLRSIC